jgi:hypothetical protein
MADQAFGNYPKTHEAYIKLCERRGVTPVLNAEQFKNVMETMRVEGLRNTDPRAFKTGVDQLVEGSSPDDLFVSLMGEVHLDALVNPGLDGLVT